MIKPKGAEYFYEGRYYKIGLHGFSYHFTNEAWIKSNKQSDEVRYGQPCNLSWPDDDLCMDVME